MMNPNNLMQQDTFITSVVFNDEALEVTYMEGRRQTENCMEVTVKAFPIGNDPEKADILAMVQSLLNDLIDRVAREQRDELNGGTNTRDAIKKRMTERAPVIDDDPEDVEDQ